MFFFTKISTTSSNTLKAVFEKKKCSVLVTHAIEEWMR